jgi:CBS domain-containing protein
VERGGDGESRGRPATTSPSEGQVIEMMVVRDVMTSAVHVVTPETPLKEVARLLGDQRISGVPVVDSLGLVVGVVSEADFLIKERGAGGVRHRPLARLLGDSRESRDALAKLAAETAGQAMSSPAVTIGPERPLSEAASLMTSRRVNRLPVVERSRLVGIVTRADLVRAYLRSDQELARTIRDEVLLRILWLDPDRFSVSVEHGVASIDGRVDRRSTAEMIERTVAMVPGLVGLHAKVQWSTDDRDIKPPTRDPFFPFSP